MRPLSDSRRRVFIDSAAYQALLDERDSNHGSAEVIVRRIVIERWQTFTTNFVVAEAYGLAVGRSGRAAAIRLLDDIDRSETIVIRVTEGDERHAREVVRRYDDKDFSLVDAMSFAVMERLGIRHAFTFDRHFAQYGFVMLDAPNGD